MNADFQFVAHSFIAGIIASIACGLGAVPLFWKRIDPIRHVGLGYAFAGGLMFAASVYNLLLPAFTIGAANSLKIWPVVQTLFGMFLGCWFLWIVQNQLTPERLQSKYLRALGGRTGALVFIAMCFHSIPEGVAVGVGFASPTHYASLEDLGVYIAIAISIHNIPEGLAVALPMRINGASLKTCFLFAFLTSLPQPFAAVPASILVWLFEPLMLPLFGFAAGAMMYLVVVEMIPDGLETHSRDSVAWLFMGGFGLMTLVQVVL